MEVLERPDAIERETVRRYKNLDDDPEFVKNHPLNADRWTAEELLERWNNAVADYKRTGEGMTLEEVQEYFHKKYGYAKII